MLTIRPSPARAHRGERRATAEKGAGQVDVERLRPDLRPSSRRTAPTSARRPRRRAPRACPIASTVGEQALDIRRPADVRRHRRRLAARVADASGDAVESLAVAGGQHDVGAGRRDRLGGGGPDPAAGARDDRQPPRQPVPRLSHRLRPRRRRRRLAGRAARARRGSAPDPDGARHDRGIASARAPPPSSTASAAAPMSSGATRKPVTPSTITSPSAPRRKATTGVPHACASAATIPNGSSHLAGHRTTAARAIASQRAVRGTPG